ncbi:hypothetical protein [Corynebacterium hylobatis]|uniref:hypothetical protein n=1 Tax=Corynebacterium hylobatis TaxID=1859290 RepID=UPI0013E0E539|nr:hypothetical protein [Corynebacterium hylobatis]
MPGGHVREGIAALLHPPHPIRVLKWGDIIDDIGVDEDVIHPLTIFFALVSDEYLKISCVNDEQPPVVSVFVCARQAGARPELTDRVDRVGDGLIEVPTHEVTEDLVLHGAGQLREFSGAAGGGFLVRSHPGLPLPGQGDAEPLLGDDLQRGMAVGPASIPDITDAGRSLCPGDQLPFGTVKIPRGQGEELKGDDVVPTLSVTDEPGDDVDGLADIGFSVVEAQTVEAAGGLRVAQQDGDRVQVPDVVDAAA